MCQPQEEEYNDGCTAVVADLQKPCRTAYTGPGESAHGKATYAEKIQRHMDGLAEVPINEQNRRLNPPHSIGGCRS